MAGERIMEALDLADAERLAFKEYEDVKTRSAQMELQPPPRNPVLAAYDLEPEAYVLRVVERVQSTALQDALLVLPFGKVVSLMGYLNIWAQRVGVEICLRSATAAHILIQEWNINLVSRMIFFLMKTHHHQIVANRVMRTALIPLRTHLRTALCRQKGTIGYNLAALQYIRRRNEAERTAQFYEEEGLDEEKIRARIAESKKRKRVYVKT